MVLCRRFVKYIYPRPRKKTVILVLALLFVVIFSMQRTAHRKHKISLIPADEGVVTRSKLIQEVVENDVHGTTTDIKKLSFIPESRYEKVQNAYNITIEPSKAVLVFTGSDNSISKDKLKFVFKSLKITFDFITWNKMDDYYTALPRFIDKYGNPRYQAFLFTNENIFDDFDAYNWDLIKRHCSQFNIGLIMFCYPVQSTSIKSKRLKALPLTLLYGVHNLKHVEIPRNSVLKLVKSPNILRGHPPGSNHVLFHTTHSTFKKIMMTNIVYEGIRSRRDADEELEVQITDNRTLYSIKRSPIALYDQGEIDGVRKFIFGVAFWESWLYRLLLIDALQIISNENLGYNLERHIQIDIDDIFVGKSGRRLVKDDVDVSKHKRRRA